MDYNSNKDRCSCGTPPTTIMPMPPGSCPQMRQSVLMEPGTQTRQPMPCRQERPAMPMMNNYPIAMSYIPMQRWNKTYPSDKGLTRGTIFPELDLPFVMGRCR